MTRRDPARAPAKPRPITNPDHAGQQRTPVRNRACDLVKWADKRPRRLSTPGPWPTPCRGADMPKGIPGSHPPCKVPGCPHKSESRGLCPNHYALWRKHGDPTIKRNRWDGITLEERFWAKVDRRGPQDCWPWTAALGPGGYGSFHRNGKHAPANRVAYELAHGPLPDGFLACHRCDNPPCCNPAHLFAGTKADNGLDMMAKGRGRGQFQRKTHCKRGHPLSGANLYIYIDRRGRQVCRICARRHHRERRARLRTGET